MTDFRTNFPKQRLSYKKKMENDKQWAKDMTDHLLLNYASADSTVNKYQSDYQRKLANYQLYNNQINQKDFERECNPLGIDVGQFKDEIQPYNKTYNKIQVLLGEEIKRPFNYRTVLVNSDGIRAKQEYKNKLLREYLQQEVQQTIELLKDPNADPQQQDQTFNPQELERFMSSTYLEGRERLGNKILQYLILKENLQDKKNDAFKHGLISGEEFVWVGVVNGEPTIDILNPLGVFYHKSAETKFLEDGLYAGYRTMMTSGDILDKFGRYLSDKDIERIEGTHQGVHGIRDDIVGKQMKYFNDSPYDYESTGMGYGGHGEQGFNEGSYGTSSGEDWLVAHVEWVSQVKVAFIRYQNEYGDEEMDIVSEDFIVPDYAEKVQKEDRYGKKTTLYLFDNKTLEWAYVPEVWQAVRIGYDMYCCMGPKEYQYRSLDNPYSVKLGYHGIIYNNMNAESVALMDRMKPFQYLYFIVAHRLKRLIARDKGKVFHFDVTQIPESLGMEKTLYYLEELDIDFFNPLQNAELAGAYQRGKVTSATDRSNMQHIMNYIQLLDALDFQISDVAGITRQREGQVASNEAVTNAQQNIVQSSTITEAAYFAPHNKLWENVLASLIQCAQSCWKNKSIIRQYALDDLSVQTLKLTPDDLENSDFGVFVSNSARDNQVFESIKPLTQALLQNDKASFSDIIKLLKASSVQEFEDQIKDSEKKLQQQQLEQIKAQQESQMQQMKLQRELSEDQQAHEIQLQEMKDAAALEREVVKATAWGGDADENGVPDVLEIEKFRHQTNIDASKIELEGEKLKQADKHKKADLKDKAAERSSKEKIAKMKPKPTATKK